MKFAARLPTTCEPTPSRHGRGIAAFRAKVRTGLPLQWALRLQRNGELLMAYFEPVRIYVTMVGILLMMWLVWKELKVIRAKTV